MASSWCILAGLVLVAFPGAQLGAAAAALVCKGTPPGTDAWCNLNCNHVPAFCPPDLCTCTGGPSPAPTPSPTPPPSPATTTTTAKATTKTTTKPATPAPTSTTTTKAATTKAPTPAPTPTTTAAAPSRGVVGFWHGYAGSASSTRAPSSGWLFSFPGLLVTAPFSGGYIPSDPSWGQYSHRILTQGGGGTSWGNTVYTQQAAQLSQYKVSAWDGVCWDWESVAADHTTAGFNALMQATKSAGLLNIVTSTAEGPYEWSASSRDAMGIDWTSIDYFVPQLYGADGTLPTGWEQYANYWVSGAGKANIHGVTFSAPPMSKVLWGVPVGQCAQALALGGAGCVEWVYSPNVHV